MSVGAICFTSSSSNGGCWVVLVFPCLFFFFWKKGLFSPYATYAKKKKASYAYFHNRGTLSSSCFVPPSSCVLDEGRATLDSKEHRDPENQTFIFLGLRNGPHAAQGSQGPRQEHGTFSEGKQASAPHKSADSVGDAVNDCTQAHPLALWDAGI